MGDTRSRSNRTSRCLRRVGREAERVKHIEGIEMGYVIRSSGGDSWFAGVNDEGETAFVDDAGSAAVTRMESLAVEIADSLRAEFGHAFEVAETDRPVTPELLP